MRDTYRSLCRHTKRPISADRTVTLETEAAERYVLNRFKGYSLLKRQHRMRSKAVMPPEAEFTEHYRAHYQLGNEEPLKVFGCALPPSATDDTLSRNDFDYGLHSLNR